MFRNLRNIPTILFQHNVESQIARRQLDSAATTIGRLFWWMQFKKMARFEKRVCRRFTRVIAVSENDKTLFEKFYGVSNVSTIPTGVDHDHFRPMPHIREKKNSLVFCGSMDWLPNEDAMKFFISNILPDIREEIADVTLTIVGRNPSPSLRALVNRVSGVSLTGWVNDTRSYIAKASVVIVPIRIGGGTRLKIYEAMAMGKALVSTTIGAEGLPVTNGMTIVIADDRLKLVEAILSLLESRTLRENIGSRARAFVQKNISWAKVAEQFDAICHQTIRDT